jgi:hypothetical protein
MTNSTNNNDSNLKTRLDFDALKNQLKNQATQEKEGGDEMAPGGNNAAGKSKLREAGAGIGGAAAGAGAAILFTGLTPAPDAVPEADAGSKSGSIPEPAHFDGSNVPVATGVTDDMSFGEAFAASRTETGPGGVFEWRGGVYGNYYATEWDGFSEDYRQQFSNYPYAVTAHDDRQPATEDAGQDDTTTHLGEPVQLEIEGHTVTATPVYTGNSDEPVALFIDADNDGIYDFKVDNEGNMAELSQQDALTWQALRDEYDGKPTGTLTAEETDTADIVINEAEIADNEVVVLHDTVDGHDVAYAQAIIDGQEVVFIDGVAINADGSPVPENADGTFDVAVVGEDIYDIRDENIKIEDIQARSDPKPDTNEQYPDYTADFENDANVNDFIEV